MLIGNYAIKYSVTDYHFYLPKYVKACFCTVDLIAQCLLLQDAANLCISPNHVDLFTESNSTSLDALVLVQSS